MSESVDKLNAMWHAGYKVGWEACNAAAASQNKTVCAWCGVILIEDPSEHVAKCERAPYAADLAALREYEEAMRSIALPNETPLGVFRRVVAHFKREVVQRAFMPGGPKPKPKAKR